MLKTNDTEINKAFHGSISKKIILIFVNYDNKKIKKINKLK